MTVVLLTLFFLAVIAIQIPTLVKGKNTREVIVYSLVLVLGMIYSYAYVLGIGLPNPTGAVEAIIEPASRVIKEFLAGSG